MVNYWLIFFLIFTAILLFMAMIWSSMASGRATDTNKCKDPAVPNECQTYCHKYAMWSALLTGFACFFILVIIVIYIFSSRNLIRKDVATQMQSGAQFVQGKASDVHGYFGQYTQPSY